MLDWVTDPLTLAATIVGWPLVGALVVTAGVAFAPPRIRRGLRLIVWLVAAVAVVGIATLLESEERAVGVWPWAFAAMLSVAGVLGYVADKDEDSKPMLVFLMPAALLLTAGLVYPAIRTALLAFTDKTGTFNGVDNFVWMFTQPEALVTLGNTLVWVVLVPLISTAVGLAYAVFIDKSRGEKVYKMLVFMPMAISFVGAGIIWKFMYAYRGPEQEQIGLVNQLIVLFGGEPQQILQNSPWNTLALILVMIWIQTGFAMVVLSAAIKGVAVEQLEAAQLDGANPWQRFRNVVVPGIRSSLVVVVTTISIATLKVFDIVRTMTAGNFDTSVVANEMYTQAFRSGEPGRGAALALVLFIMVLPIVVYNIRVMNQQKAIR
ncbi:carbohydrate ABC transporter permease [Agrococcus sp. 1P02AA]|uniref:carbohydrate ABC transporter permease n=1 Tax=Agrococcus sp. 1P02AA TaxID=3132259 RepID=UPI0039A44FF0